MITGPSAEVNVIQSLIGARLDTTTGLYTVDCSQVGQMPEITLSIAGRNFVFKGSDYVIQVRLILLAQRKTGLLIHITQINDEVNPSVCYSAFLSLDVNLEEGSLWLLGETFVGAVYTIFDRGNNRMGFAEAACTTADCSSGIQPLLPLMTSIITMTSLITFRML